jgi:hypothetical protein
MAPRRGTSPEHAFIYPPADDDERMTIVRGVLARVFVDDADHALPTYQKLSGDVAPRRFRFHDVDLAWVG